MALVRNCSVTSVCNSYYKLTSISFFQSLQAVPITLCDCDSLKKKLRYRVVCSLNVSSWPVIEVSGWDLLCSYGRRISCLPLFLKKNQLLKNFEFPFYSHSIQYCSTDLLVHAIYCIIHVFLLVCRQTRGVVLLTEADRVSALSPCPWFTCRNDATGRGKSPDVRCLRLRFLFLVHALTWW